MSMDPNGLDVLQSMIDISAKRLEGLRTQCATNVTLTQEEIRSLEAKLVRMFSDLLVTKSRLLERIPSSGLSTSGPELRQWLRVVGLGQESLLSCLQRLNTLEELIEKSDEELKDLLTNSTISKEEEIRRLTTATSNLKRCYKTLRDGQTYPENLYWDSWDRQSHHHHHYYHHRSDFNYGESGTGVASPRSRLKPTKVRQSPVTSVLSNTALCANNVNSNLSNIGIVTCNSENVQSPSNTTTPEEFSSFHGSVHTLTPSPSPPNSPCLTNSSGDGFGTGYNSSGGTVSGGGGKLGHRKSGTPPPNKKHQTLLSSHSSTPSHKPYPSSGNNNNQNVLKSGLLGSQQAIEQINKSKSPDTQNLSQEQILIQTALNQSTNYGVQNPNNNNISHIINTPRSRLLTESSPDTPSFGSSGAPTNRIISEANATANNLQVPRSPCTPITGGSMKHTIQHRFTKSIKVSNCDLCQKQMFWGLKCKECKYRCHKDCEPNVPPSCGLPRELFDEFKKTLTNDPFMPANTSPNLSSNRNPSIGGPGLLTTNQNRRQKTSANYPTHDSSSPGSSCNSSSPSSPALFNSHSQQSSQHSSYSTASGSTGGNHHQISTPLSAAHKGINQFNFPDVTVTASHQNNTHILHSGGNSTGGAILTGSLGTHFEKSENYQTSTSISVSISNCSSVVIGSNNGDKKNGDDSNNSTGGNNQIRPPLSELADTHKSNDSDKTVSLSGSTSASTDSDRTPVRLDSTEEGDSGNWARQHSLSLKEWDIPYDDLKLLEKIGKGRFGTVHRALWHGDVAVKLLKEDYLDDERTLEAFKLEVANFKKTRHENLVLFMGACMKPPYLAIVTSLCKGNTLYTYIHLRKDKFNMSRTTLVAQQISQGMGYLHARGIFHKDLRTKNIFLENGKVIITDFGLFSSTKLIYCDLGLGIPNGWLCYLAPELMRSLTPYKPTDEILPFSRASDVYSFGTVWYELLCGEFPFKIQSPESIIWQVGRGMKQTLANLQTSRDVKDILMLCWSFQADDRPDFPKLLTLLERLPKKRLARSPSHPIQLSRSAESVF